MHRFLVKRSLLRISTKRYCHTEVGDNAESYVGDKAGSQNEKTEIGVIEEQVKQIFEEKMKNDSFPLFTNWSNYEKWLPVRNINKKFRKLYELPHWIKEKDLDFVVDRLAYHPTEARGARELVRYLAAPTAYGKTSLILPAFLRSTKRKDLIGFSHYVYIAFENNASRSFRFLSELNRNCDLAKKQGGAFVVQCVETILANQEVPREDDEDAKFFINVDMDDNALGENCVN